MAQIWAGGAPPATQHHQSTPPPTGSTTTALTAGHHHQVTGPPPTEKHHCQEGEPRLHPSRRGEGQAAAAGAVRASPGGLCRRRRQGEQGRGDEEEGRERSRAAATGGDGRARREGSSGPELDAGGGGLAGGTLAREETRELRSLISYLMKIVNLFSRFKKIKLSHL